MRRVTVLCAMLLVCGVVTAAAKQLYASDFEKDAVGVVPPQWEQVFKGNGKASVIKDPADAGNKALASSDLAANQARHDVGGSIYAVGDAAWQDYIVEWDGYFPEEYYMGVLFRFQGPEAFYLFDRRSGGEAGNFDFWRRQGAWTGVQRAGKFATEPKKWYRFRLVVKGDTFDAYVKAANDATPFSKQKPILTGKDATFATGRVALYGLIYVDNLVIGESENDLVLAVAPKGKLAAVWAEAKSSSLR
jgi:hypothetical protein